MDWRRHVAVAALVATSLVAGGGCSFLPRFSTEPTPIVPQAEIPTVRVRAIPAYRLVFDPKLQDAPSRLVVLHAVIGARGTDPLHFDPANVRLVLPNGTEARIFDRTRAGILMERTDLALWNLAYTRKPGHPAGGIPGGLRPKLTAKIGARLMNEANLRPGTTVKGYFVVDTKVPLKSFDNVSLEIVATRISDSMRVQQTYEFASRRTRQTSQ